MANQKHFGGPCGYQDHFRRSFSTRDVSAMLDDARRFTEIDCEWSGNDSRCETGSEPGSHPRADPLAETSDRASSQVSHLGDENLYDSPRSRERISVRKIVRFAFWSFVTSNTVIVNTLYKIFRCSRSSCLFHSLLKNTMQIFFFTVFFSWHIRVDIDRHTSLCHVWNMVNSVRAHPTRRIYARKSRTRHTLFFV